MKMHGVSQVQGANGKDEDRSNPNGNGLSHPDLP